MTINNITITSDSEIGYHVYITYINYKEKPSLLKTFGVFTYDEDIEKILNDIIIKIKEWKNE